MFKLKVEPDNDLCRCCHAESVGTFKNVYEPYSWLDVEVVYSKLLQECFEIELVPVTQILQHSLSLICDICIEKVQDATHFKRQVLVCEKQFQDHCGNSVFRETSSIVKQESPLDLKGDTCRCCHAEGATKNLYEPHYSWMDGEEVMYSKLLLEGFGIEMAPAPESFQHIVTICDLCVERLLEAVKFKRQIVTCEKRFRVIHGSSIPGEDALEVKVKQEVEVNVTRLSDEVEIEIKPFPETSRGSLSGDHFKPIEDLPPFTHVCVSPPGSIVAATAKATKRKSSRIPTLKVKKARNDEIEDQKREELKKKNRDWVRAKRAKMEEKEKEAMKKKNRDRERARIAQLGEKEKEEFQKKVRENTRVRQAKMGEEEKEEIKKKTRERVQARIAKMGEEQLEELKKKMRERARARRAVMSEEEREELKRKMRERARARRAKMSVEEKEEVKKKMRERARARRAEMGAVTMEEYIIKRRENARARKAETIEQGKGEV